MIIFALSYYLNLEFYRINDLFDTLTRSDVILNDKIETQFQNGFGEFKRKDQSPFWMCPRTY